MQRPKRSQTRSQPCDALTPGGWRNGSRWASRNSTEWTLESLLLRMGWALRSLAAISWAESNSLDAGIGQRLAADPDARVRRALAGALSRTEPDERTAAARQKLQNDPRHSVRTCLRGL